MRRLCAFAVFTLVAALAAWPRPAAVDGAPGWSGGPPPLQALGVSSCAAAACHHGNGERGTKGSEYSTWVAVDPHARAYRTLFKPESRAMHEVLARADPALAKTRGAHDNPLCLRCHGMGDNVPAALHQDGTGCEQCHGPASRWKATHYLDGFNRRTPGFRDLRNDLAARAETCMKCHVGDASREVNHDLIAAGHPRLRFEFAAYYANYPRHWDDAALSARDGKDREARHWAVGQLVAARSALELLAHRADVNKDAPWPELAEFDCAACHHGLAKPSFRQQRDAKRPPGQGRAGRLPWGTWYTALLPALSDAVPGGNAKELAEDLAALDRLLGARLPNRKAVQSEAARAARLLSVWLTQARGAKYTPAQVEALLRTVAAQGPLLEQGFDGATQVYLGLAALHQARGDLDPAFRERSPVKKPLLGLRQSLYDAYPREARPLYDSPLKYDPKAALGDLQSIRDALK